MVSAHTAHVMRQHKLVSRRFALDKDSFVYTYRPAFKGIFHADHLPGAIGMLGAVFIFALMSLQFALMPFVALEKQTLAYQQQSQAYLASIGVEPSPQYLAKQEVMRDEGQVTRDEGQVTRDEGQVTLAEKTTNLNNSQPTTHNPQPAVLGVSTTNIFSSFIDALKASIGDLFFWWPWKGTGKQAEVFEVSQVTRETCQAGDGPDDSKCKTIPGCSWYACTDQCWPTGTDNKIVCDCTCTTGGNLIASSCETGFDPVCNSGSYSDNCNCLIETTCKIESDFVFGDVSKTFNFTCNASGGDGTYSFKEWAVWGPLDRDYKSISGINNDSNSNLSIVFDQAGMYYVYCIVKSNNGTSCQDGRSVRVTNNTCNQDGVCNRSSNSPSKTESFESCHEDCCKAEETRCVDGKIQTCSNKNPLNDKFGGSDWLSPVSCPTGQTCQNDKCTDEIVDDVQTESQACIIAGGTWEEFSNGCADKCNSGPYCTQVITQGCNCPGTACWDGTKCVGANSCSENGDACKIDGDCCSSYCSLGKCANNPNSSSACNLHSTQSACTGDSACMWHESFNGAYPACKLAGDYNDSKKVDLDDIMYILGHYNGTESEFTQPMDAILIVLGNYEF